MTDDQWVSILEAVLARRPVKKIPLTQTESLLRSYGTVDLEDKATQREAVATFLRALLRDPDIQALMKVTRELQMLTAATNALTSTMSVPEQMRFANPVREYTTDLVNRIDSLQKKTSDKIRLISRVVTLLRELNYDEEYELPALDVRFPLFQ